MRVRRASDCGYGTRRDLWTAAGHATLLRMSKKMKLVPREPTSVGRELMRWRKAKGWTRRQAATELGVNVRTLESWEYGYRKPPALVALEKLWAEKRRAP